jgi:hypothetical protein
MTYFTFTETDMAALEDRIKKALELASNVDGAHHKQWIIDQMVRALTGCPLVERQSRDGSYTYETQGESEEYLAWRRAYEGDEDEDGDHEYEWDEGIAP